MIFIHLGISRDNFGQWFANSHYGRTEGFNGVLGKKIDKKGHFFRFVRALLLQERDKFYDVRNLIATGGLSANAQKNKDKVSGK